MAKDFVSEATMKEQIVQKPTRKSFRDLEGMVVGHITVGGWAGIIKGENYWWCKCDCGPYWFKVRSYSLLAGATTSCGCAYANNGKSTQRSAKWFESKLQGWHLIGEYKGYNHPIQIACDTCGETRSISKAANAMHQSCNCSRKVDQKREEIFRSYGFRLLEGHIEVENRNRKKYLCECMNCKIQQYLSTTEVRKCPCHLGIEDPCAVYVLTSPTKSFIKIGKALNPEHRVKSINKSGAVDFEIAHIEWVSGEHCAYILESFLHAQFGGKDYDFRPGFSGDTEIFQKSLKDVKRVLAKIAFSLEKLRKGVVPPDLRRVKRLPELSEWSFEFDGYWYPCISYLWKLFGYKRNPMNTEETLATFSTHEEISKWVERGVWTKYGVSYADYCAIIKDLGVSHETIRDRLINKGWSWERAISTPIQKIKNVLYKGERMTVAAFFRLHNIPAKAANSYKCKLALPPVEAIIKTAEHFGVIVDKEDLKLHVK